MKGTRAIVALSVLSALSALADEPAPTPTTPPAATAAPRKTGGTPSKGTAAKAPAPSGAPGTANMVVTKDPETGELRPATAAEREKLLGRKALVSPERRVVTLPDGTLMIELGDADMSYAVVKKNPDGTITRSCVHGDANAAKAAAPSPTAAAPASADR